MQYVIGIDEVGRGSLAGPVTVAAVAMPRGIRFSRTLPKLRDSKKLTLRNRKLWCQYFKSHPQVFYAIAYVYPSVIEKLNISKAANLAAERAFGRLSKNCKLSPKNCSIYLDGGLYLGNLIKNPHLSVSTVIKGDEKITAIKAASIVAKVHRDNAMIRLAKRYPRYGFEMHKGYGTKLHRKAIKKHGPSETHRKTFLKLFV